jgi:hypothetical protein
LEEKDSSSSSSSEDSSSSSEEKQNKKKITVDNENLKSAKPKSEVKPASEVE